MINWTVQLEVLVPKPCYDRPFVCEGFPSTSLVIVIGENPATPMKKDWWSYWNPKIGFKYEDFVSDYTAERAAIGKGISNTRRRLNRFRDNGIYCVETNAFRNEKLDGAGEGIGNYEILNFLICNMPNLAAIVAHGKIATDFLDSAEVPANVQTYKTRHFRMESYAEIDKICRQVHGNT